MALLRNWLLGAARMRICTIDGSYRAPMWPNYLVDSNIQLIGALSRLGRFPEHPAAPAASGAHNPLGPPLDRHSPVFAAVGPAFTYLGTCSSVFDPIR